MSGKKTEQKPQDFIQRGVKKSSPIGSTVLVGLRGLDPILQYAILAGSLGSTIIQECCGTTLPPSVPVITNTIIDNLALSPHRLALLSMAIGSALKQIVWVSYTSQEMLPVSSAVLISVYNTMLNSINALLFMCSQTSAAAPEESFWQPQLLIGCALYILGLVTEQVCELQRKRFKDNPVNKGKVCDSGLFSLARHINYGAYTVWRAGYAMASAGWVFGSFMGLYFFVDFAWRGVPALDRYCQDRVGHVFLAPKLRYFLHALTAVDQQYGKQWTNFKAKVPYALLPLIY